VPIPVPQSISTGGEGLTTIQYKDFGVGLSFTPTVIAQDTVNLEIKSEVSSIDPSVSITTNGITVPGFKVRRSNTTIELKDGQSFAIAGLIQDDFQDSINQIPGLGNLPIIGALMRSTSYQHNQTELVVFITVHLVQPVVAKALMSPIDTVILPSPLALFGLGQLNGNPAPGGGIDGTYGYILP
jgi:pilus assembly protein CpaC